MSDRLILELKSKFKSEIQFEEEKRKMNWIKDPEINKMMSDLQLTLQSLNYTKNEIKNILPIILKKTYSTTTKEENNSFEDLLKLAMNYLDNDSNIAR